MGYGMTDDLQEERAENAQLTRMLLALCKVVENGVGRGGSIRLGLVDGLPEWYELAQLPEEKRQKIVEAKAKLTDGELEALGLKR